MTLLQIDHLRIDAGGTPGSSSTPIVQDVGFTLHEGETLALVGESGSGKSMTALAIMGLLPGPGVRQASGRVLFRGRDLATFSSREMESVRGAGIGMIFQEPMTALNPVYSIGEQVAEVLRHHRGMGRSEAKNAAIRLLERVEIPDPEQRFDSYPHEFSGGMRQRVMISIAIAAGPSMLIADEPTTALDVRTQRGVLDLLQSFVQTDRMGLLLISHDMALVGERSDRICVLCRGRICEMGPTRDILLDPLHPYTRGLLECTLSLRSDGTTLASMASVLERPDLAPLTVEGDAEGRIPWWPSERLEGASGHRQGGWSLVEASKGRFVGVCE
ncbi:MAG: peptide ABC transporter ATP-binding protein [Phycisphaerae bacterium]|nr:peptide ABC transporter ATP-binding protein [Phycisphaerae bacterium]|tara:strand:+ start:10743 stop:11732 length:990 start_codon:yes stop_codon:yes gene_type:complete